MKFIGKYINKDLEKYLNHYIPDLPEYLNKIETKWEDDLIELLSRVDIRAMRKTDKHSLPYTDEVVVKLNLESYINGMFERERVFRPILKKLLEQDARKIRFYLHVDTYYGGEGKYSMLTPQGIRYSFRYYVHKPVIFT